MTAKKGMVHRRGVKKKILKKSPWNTIKHVRGKTVSPQKRQTIGDSRVRVQIDVTGYRYRVSGARGKRSNGYGCDTGSRVEPERRKSRTEPKWMADNYSSRGVDGDGRG